VGLPKGATLLGVDRYVIVVLGGKWRKMWGKGAKAGTEIKTKEKGEVTIISTSHQESHLKKGKRDTVVNKGKSLPKGVGATELGDGIGGCDVGGKKALGKQIKRTKNQELSSRTKKTSQKENYNPYTTNRPAPGGVQEML